MLQTRRGPGKIQQWLLLSPSLEEQSWVPDSIPAGDAPLQIGVLTSLPTTYCPRGGPILPGRLSPHSILLPFMQLRVPTPRAGAYVTVTSPTQVTEVALNDDNCSSWF